ncbi:RNA-binding (RRM/RBD/RNP motifs) family protein [Wolffia australiana]
MMDNSIKKRKGEENGIVDAAVAASRLAPSDARKIIESFSKEQLLEIVQEATCRHGDVLAAVRSVADQDLSQRKLFIRGLGWETTADGLRSLFSAYGELEEAVVIMDKNTGKSKGYGFIVFRHIDGAILALKEPSKKIDGRMSVSQLASSGASGAAIAQPQAADVGLRKIYVGNVPYDMSSERLLSHFSSYGEIEEGPLGFDKQTGKSRGFALFVYKTVDGAKASLVDATKVIDGHTMVCKLAADGKKGKPGQIVDPSSGGRVGVVAAATSIAQASTSGPLPGQFSGPGALPSYGGFSGPGIQGQGVMGHHQFLNPGVSSSVLSVGSQGGNLGSVGSGYGGGLGPFSSQYGGPTPPAFGAMGVSSSFRMVPSSAPMSSGSYPEGNYGLSSAYQQNGSSPAQRGPSGVIYPGVPPPYF